MMIELMKSISNLSQSRIREMVCHLGFVWSTSSIALELHRLGVGFGHQGNGICISIGEDILDATEAGGLLKLEGDRHSNGGEMGITGDDSPFSIE